MSKERDIEEGTSIKPKIDKKSKRMGLHDYQQDNLTVHERLHKINHKKAKGKILKSLNKKANHVQSQSTIGTQRYYMTERLNIGEMLAQKSQRSKSRSKNQNKNIYSSLYDDAFKRQINQNKLGDELLKGQSVRSFIKQRNNSNTEFTGIFSKSARSFRKDESSIQGSNSSRLYKNKEQN